ncbi:hypothetical protein GWO52_03585 [Corynebacterium macginleyi]|uniref:hypothetical protein n=1 Tax=Corynebacterium macginleyi TaxID=38290 RepID=UPI00190CFE25|nr:hypothetical protein [Corynebacterium macginleyi]MBK4137552.1 hypothetical protein [Corynebacterium macginleyi]MBK4141114.1 hypothetical protein [Corynebacterium macginleyi]
MSFQLQLEMGSATVGELAALLSAARAAGVRDDDVLEIEGNTLTITVSAPQTSTPGAGQNPDAAHRQDGLDRQRGAEFSSRGPADRIGEATIRSLIDMLIERGNGNSSRGNGYGFFGGNSDYHG